MTMWPRAIHMIIGPKTILMSMIWYRWLINETHMDHAEIINMRIEIEREFEFPMYASKWTWINKTSVES